MQQSRSDIITIYLGHRVRYEVSQASLEQSQYLQAILKPEWKNSNDRNVLYLQDDPSPMGLVPFLGRRHSKKIPEVGLEWVYVYQLMLAAIDCIPCSADIQPLWLPSLHIKLHDVVKYNCISFSKFNNSRGLKDIAERDSLFLRIILETLLETLGDQQKNESLVRDWLSFCVCTPRPVWMFLTAQLRAERRAPMLCIVMDAFEAFVKDGIPYDWGIAGLRCTCQLPCRLHTRWLQSFEIHLKHTLHLNSGLYTNNVVRDKAYRDAWDGVLLHQFFRISDVSPLPESGAYPPCHEALCAKILRHVRHQICFALRLDPSANEAKDWDTFLDSDRTLLEKRSRLLLPRFQRGSMSEALRQCMSTVRTDSDLDTMIRLLSLWWPITSH